MDRLKKYDISFLGLKEGEHEFEFHADGKFFESFETSEVREGNVKITALLEKSSRLMVLNFTIQGDILMMCDRCLDDFGLPVDFKGKLFLKYGEGDDEAPDDVVFLNENDHTFNIAQYIFESVHLSLPYKRTHPNDKNGKSTCNMKMLKKLEELSIQNSNHENYDSRWDQLKKITNN